MKVQALSRKPGQSFILHYETKQIYKTATPLLKIKIRDAAMLARSGSRGFYSFQTSMVFYFFTVCFFNLSLPGQYLKINPQHIIFQYIYIFVNPFLAKHTIAIYKDPFMSSVFNTFVIPGVARHQTDFTSHWNWKCRFCFIFLPYIKPCYNGITHKTQNGLSMMMQLMV